MEHVEQSWVVTEKMAKEAKKEGLAVDKAIEILRSAKSILNECHLNVVTRGELLPKANALISDAQREIFSITRPLGSDFEEKWTEELKRALRGEKIGEFIVEGSSKFYSNMPRSKEWVRVAVPKEATKKLKDIEKRSGVEIQKDGDLHVIIIGKKESIRRALDEMAPYFKEK